MSDIRLASKKVSIKNINFFSYHEDPEDNYAQQRFIWLYEIALSNLNENIIKTCLVKIENWIDNEFELINDSKFDSYSASERIIAWIFFVMFINNKYKITKELLIKITKSISRQSEMIVNNLEYHGDKTNNHILNNGRGLYIIGTVFKKKKISEVGRKIIFSEYENFFINGIFQEGSTHYQMLLTKWFLDLSIISNQYKDLEFSNYINERISELLFVCNQISGRNDSLCYPLFGDISPDMNPEWFVGWPFSNNKQKVSKWFNLIKNISPALYLNSNKNNNFTNNVGNINWQYLNKNDIEIWINLRSGKIPPHGHNDNGTIQVNYKRNPIIIDPGLKSYTHNSDYYSQKDGFHHNMPIINGFSVDVPPNSLAYELKKESNYKLLHCSNDKIIYQVEYANNRIKIVREIKLFNNSLSIIDSHQDDFYQTLWHYNGLFNKISPLTYKGANFSISFEGENDLKSNLLDNYFSSSNYGESQELSTIIIKNKKSQGGFVKTNFIFYD